MRGLSSKEMEIVSWLEFYKKYFFSAKDIEQFSKSRMQRYNIIKGLIQKGRIVKLGKTRYCLVPVKAKSGKWAEHPFIIADEACGGKDYFIGGWAAANYWGLTEQIPMQTDVYTTRRQGVLEALSSRIVFHRTTKAKAERAVKKEISKHRFRIQPKKDSRKWMESRQ
ncbi:MAG: hypothetical protein PHO02_01385 [Candidatus Nanoarchaeia archaeon]|nr:hypothetical protein [Candidatus Nanoarchaeia archaeon]